MLLSVCMIARDESRCIGDAIRSARSLADEVIVVDTGSRDTTPHVASQLGARVLHQPWQDDFSLHRNHAIDQALGRWVLILDADEVIEPADFGETRSRLAGDGLPDILMVKHWSTYPGGDSVLEYLARIVRRDSGIRYVHPIHEQLKVRGEEALLSNLVLRHSGYTGAERLRQKHERNLRIAQMMPDDEPHAHHCRMRSLAALGRWDEAARAADALLALHGVADPVRYDAHVLAAAARLEAARRGEPNGDFREHLGAARALDPLAPDVPYLEMFASALDYLKALDRANTPGTAEFLRIAHFWRAGSSVEELVRTMTGETLDALSRRGQVRRSKSDEK